MEIVQGVITVSSRRVTSHHFIADSMTRCLYRVIPEDRGIHQTLAVAIPSRLGMYIPDLVVAPDAALREEGNYIPAAAAELVVEITSKSNARHDRISKPAGYAAAGVPLYLLIDAHAPGGPTVTLYGEPKGDVYRLLSAGKFGDEVTLPAPFDLTLDTGEFPVS
ncbi:Uma2 family endonuclease [Streptomyces ficellus]|uniref:Uma2 family endonuclease n=1 Tax=Streptomyces ficellus TaxID=1977088 RepID=UPI00338F6305